MLVITTTTELLDHLQNRQNAAEAQSRSGNNVLNAVGQAYAFGQAIEAVEAYVEYMNSPANNDE